MDSKWAEQNLRVIRTLMESAAIYRRALAPVMLFAGLMGVLAVTVSLVFHLNSIWQFFEIWLTTAVVAMVGALVIARRQAIKNSEPFWSPPTKRIVLALAPPLFAGFWIALVLPYDDVHLLLAVTVVWMLFYGCALHAAGFFMPGGIKFFGWFFIFSGCVIGSITSSLIKGTAGKFSAQFVMGFFFGVMHLAYGVYLYLTEKGKNEA